MVFKDFYYYPAILTDANSFERDLLRRILPRQDLLFTPSIRFLPPASAFCSKHPLLAPSIRFLPPASTSGSISTFCLFVNCLFFPLSCLEDGLTWTRQPRLSVTLRPSPNSSPLKSLGPPLSSQAPSSPECKALDLLLSDMYHKGGKSYAALASKKSKAYSKR